MSSSTLQIDSGEPDRGGRVDSSLLRALEDPATYGGDAPVEVHETHASWVFVTGERAYKLKKPVALAFLDYSTLSRRHAACREEVRVNRELAPDIYLGVRAILPSETGFELAPEHADGAIEYVVEMRRFRESDTLAGLIEADALVPEQIRAVGHRLSEFHRKASVAAGGSAEDVLHMWRKNIAELAQQGHASRWQLGVTEAFGEAFARAHEAEIEQRRSAGLVRDGHGDLRCEHILTVPTVRVVDRVEFDPALRRTDVACDLAFLLMDLQARGQRWAAPHLISAYVQGGMDPGGEALLAFYAAHRALVRAKVGLIAAGELEVKHRQEQLDQAEALWALAERLCWRARSPVALIVCGPAASGKSTLAAELSRRSEMPVVCSDAVRKAAAGLAPTERAAPEHYSEGFTRTTYELLAREAQLAFGSEQGVIVDATCRSRADRAPLLRRLGGAGVTLLVVRCELPVEVALERAERRMREVDRVSDATPAVAAEQYRSFEPLDELPRESVLELDTAEALDAQAARVTRAVDRRLAETVITG